VGGAENPPRAFDEFWPHYVRAHSKRATRALHFVGTTAAMALVGGAIVLRRPSVLLLAVVAGYAPAWLAHFFVEKNRPATFDHPIHSFRADLVMWAKIATGTMDTEVKRHAAGNSRDGHR
jgi:hypothetical protein